MQITDLSKELDIPALLRLGFRPFFLFGSLFSIIALSLWGLTLNNIISLDFYGGANWWHMHEMVFGFICAIIVGFLLTAVQTWTGQRGLHGKSLLALILVWLAGRIALLFPDIFGQLTAALIDISFLPLAAYFLAKPIIKVKQTRNLFFVPLLLLFTVANIEMHLASVALANMQLFPAAHASMMLVAMLMSVMAGRVIPMFTANGTGTAKVASIAWLEKVTNGSIALIVIAFLIHPLVTINSAIFFTLFLIAGLSQMARWLRWKPWITISVPLLWSLHTAVMFVWLGLLALAFSFMNNALPANHFWHLLTIGGMGGIILAMISRVSLGHTGNVLKAPKLMPLAFLLISFSAILRSIGPWLIPADYLLFINVSIVVWLLAYGLFIVYYAPKLMQARQDGRPG
ncbi:NnrS family protein [Colwelliaceae bacterium BS250]